MKAVYQGQFCGDARVHIESVYYSPSFMPIRFTLKEALNDIGNFSHKGGTFRIAKHDGKGGVSYIYEN